MSELTPEDESAEVQETNARFYRALEARDLEARVDRERLAERLTGQAVPPLVEQEDALPHQRVGAVDARGPSFDPAGSDLHRRRR